MDSWHTWELVLPALERRHEVLAPTHPGHAGGPRLEGPVTEAAVPDAVERAMDEAGFGTAHVVGNSLGGYVALQLAERGRARSVVAFAPAGGWVGTGSMSLLFERQRALHSGARWRAPQAPAFLDFAEGADWPLDAERIRCPLRFVWGTADELLPWPDAAARWRAMFRHADWIELDSVGHYPQLEAPIEAAQLILGLTAD